MSVFCELQLCAKHHWLEATQTEHLWGVIQILQGVPMCSFQVWFFNLFFLILHTYQQGFLFSSFRSIYSSITVACMSLGGRSHTKLWTTCQWVYHWRKVFSCPRSPLTAHSSSRRGRISRAHPQSMTEYWPTSVLCRFLQLLSLSTVHDGMLAGLMLSVLCRFLLPKS